MTNKELRKLSRVELLEMLIAQMKENEKLSEELDQALEELENRKIKMDKAGSIAEAALQLSGIFEAADAAVEQYLANVKGEISNQKAESDRMKEETIRKCKVMIAETEKKCAARERAMEIRCKELSILIEEKTEA